MKLKTGTNVASPAARSPTHGNGSRRTTATARTEAEAANDELRAMQALTDTALSHLALDDLLRELLDRVAAVMGVDHVAIPLLNEDGQTLTSRAARGLLPEAVGGPKIPVGQGFTGRMAANREPLIVDDLSSPDLEGAHPLAREQVRSALGVPLLVEDVVEDPLSGHRMSRLLGVLQVGSATPRRFTAADVQLLQRAADRIALAIDRAGLFSAEQDARRRAEVALTRAVVSEAQAAERAERLNTILETIADGVAVYDVEGRPLQLANRAYRDLYALEQAPAGFEALTTFDRARLIQMRDAATGELLPSEKTPVGRALRGEVVGGSGGDVRLKAFDGRELEVNCSAAPLREPNGQISGAVLVLRDVTERKQLERDREEARARAEAANAEELAAREVSRHMETFLATAAHDLRTPLGTIVGYLELAQRKTDGLASAVSKGFPYPELASQVAAVRARLDDVDHSSARLSRLVNLLFDLAAIRAGKLELHRAPCELGALVHEQVEAMRAAAPGRTIRLQAPAVEPRGGPIVVGADADRLAEVVTNYLANALKYSPPDRPVDVSAEVRKGQARVAVRDLGSGIPKEDRARVWELFHRVPGCEAHATTSSGVQGSSLGLGLYTCKVIITAHGGRVGVKSTVGQGSTFWFTLPLSGPAPVRSGAAL
jgi:signal transduction histidine kinase/putative methionine-R-sulfoxide reductase with GAF domain